MSKKKHHPNRLYPNDPCPCGSNKKYKKCCQPKEGINLSSEIIKKMEKALQRQELKKQFLQGKGIFINYVNPCTYTNPKTNKKVKAWAIANKMFHTRPEHETFHDFIIDYFKKEVLGREWWEEQSKADQKHFLYQCFTKFEEWSKKNAVNANKVDDYTWVATTDGWTKTLISLAFDICSLEHTKQLPDHLKNRLKNYGEYQGAHYEIAIAAIFSRLGCKIDFLDDNKLTTKHCEFIATHNETGVSIAVECKSRQRPGVKHATGTTNESKLLHGDVQKLLNRALKQNPKNNPFIIFIDINSPLTPDIKMEEKPWFNDIKKIMDTYPDSTKEKPEDFTALIFTNFSPHYNDENESTPNEYLAVIPLYSIHPMPSNAFGNMLLDAVKNYGFVPNITEINN